MSALYAYVQHIRTLFSHISLIGLNSCCIYAHWRFVRKFCPEREYWKLNSGKETLHLSDLESESETNGYVPDPAKLSRKTYSSSWLSYDA